MGEDRNELDSSFVLWANRYMGIQGRKSELRMFPDFLILLLEVVIKNNWKHFTGNLQKNNRVS